MKYKIQRFTCIRKSASQIECKNFKQNFKTYHHQIENHEAAVALHYMHYNFARIHQTLRVTPAMEAGIADHIWSLEEIVGLLP